MSHSSENKVTIAPLSVLYLQELQLKTALKTIFFMALGTLGGCSWLVGEGALFDDSEYDYTKAKMTKEMQVPESVGEANTQDHFLVPELGDDVKGVIYGDNRDIMAPMQALTLGNKVREDRTSEYSSVYVTDTEIRLWDMIERYLKEQNIPILEKDLEKGVIVTDWQVIEDDSFWSGEIKAWRYRYQINLSSAPRPSENIMTVKLIAAEKLVSDTDSWRPIVDTQRSETEFLNSIIGFLYVEDIAASRLLVNQSAIGGIVVTLGSDSNNKPALVTSANFEHVWTRIPISLSLLNIAIDDQDRTQKLFFINHKSDDKGFFASLAFWSESDGDILDLPEGPYQIQVASLGDKITMTFLDDVGNAISADLLAKNFPILSKAFKAKAPE